MVRLASELNISTEEVKKIMNTIKMEPIVINYIPVKAGEKP